MHLLVLYLSYKNEWSKLKKGKDVFESGNGQTLCSPAVTARAEGAAGNPLGTSRI
jgi:hypothetical protein